MGLYGILFQYINRKTRLLYFLKRGGIFGTCVPYKQNWHTPPNFILITYMHALSCFFFIHGILHSNYMHELEDKKSDVILNSLYFKNSKSFIAQIVGPMQKLSSQNRFGATRSSKLDPMLVCFDDFFSNQKLPRLGYISYHAYCMQVTVLFSHKLPWLCFSTTFSFLGRKLPQCLYISYRVCCSYITCYFHITYRGFVFQ